MEKVIFFGNGLNRLVSSNISWGDLLDKIKNQNKFDDDKLPNTMIYERIVLQKLNTNEDILQDEFELKVDIAELLRDIKGNEVYKNLFELDCQHYITTNYDYGFIDSIIGLKDINLPISEHSTEDVYSVRRLKSISTKKEKKKHFWQIHGEIRRPATIMLGLDQYSGSISKLNDYVKGNYKYQRDGVSITEASIEDKLNDNKLNESSWAELFFGSDIHIMGFSFDFSEMDLWWLLTRRARMKKSPRTKSLIKNSIHFYCHEIDDQKKALFESLDISVHVLKLGTSGDKYIKHYENIIKMI